MLTLVAVRQEVGTREQVVVVEAVNGHGRVLPHAAPEPAHGAQCRFRVETPPLPASSQSLGDSASCQPIRGRGGRGGTGFLKRQRRAVAWQQRGRGEGADIALQRPLRAAGPGNRPRSAVLTPRWVGSRPGQPGCGVGVWS